MKKKKAARRIINTTLKKQVCTTAVALGLTAGTVAGVAAYQNQQEFTPSGADGDLHTNQVLFPYDEGDTGLDGQTEDNRDSAFLDKNKSDDQLKMADGASFLFDNNQYTPDNPSNQTALNDETSGNDAGPGQIVAVPDGTANTDPNADTTTDGTQGVPTTTPDTVYDVIDDSTKADTIISDPGTSGPSNDTTTDTSKPGNTEIGENGNGNGNGGHGSGGSQSGDSGQKPSGDKKDDSGSATDKPSGGNTDKPSKPAKRPAETAKDPTVSADQKEKPSFPGADMVIPKPITEDVFGKNNTPEIGTTGKDNYVLRIGELFSDTYRLYAGQTITAMDLFCALDTYILSRNDGVLYYFDGNPEYIRIDSVSFDGGISWQSSFPVTIPMDMGGNDIQIRVSWRISVKDSWKTETASYTAREGRILLLKRRITNENEEISENDLLNWDDFYMGQYPEVGKTFLLLQYSYVDGILGEVTDENDRISMLFPGWTEGDGEPFWKYEITAGRHVIEPAELVPLDEKYIVKNEMMWMSDDMKVGDGYNLVKLQTLTGLEGQISLWQDASLSVDTLSVPKYVQAVEIAEGNAITADTMEIPDTVLYIKTDNDNMLVRKAYVVDQGNQTYASDSQGLLWNKEYTELMGVPYSFASLTIPSGTQKVDIPSLNQLHELTFDMDADSAFPKINLENLQGCHLFVHENRLFDFFESKSGDLATYGCRVSSVENQEDVYTVKDDMVLNQKNELGYAFSTTGANFNIPENIIGIEENALCNAKRVSALILKEGEQITLQKNCLKNSSVRQIICATQKQYEDIVEQLSVAGTENADGIAIQVQLSTVTSDGFSYYTEGTGDETKVTLIKAPQELQAFDGTIDGGKMTVDVIGDGAFSGSDVQWVTLPEKIKTIGYRAFRNCNKLEGILIESTDTITIGNQAFDDCQSLRFVASNALKATMEEGYDPLIVDQYYSVWQGNNYFFVLQNATGYGYNVNIIGETTGIERYTLLSDEENPACKMLYGLDENNKLWFAVRSGKTVPEQLTLSTETEVISDYAFADTRSVSGKYTVNWEDLPEISWIERGAFENADLSGNLILGSKDDIIQIEDEAFELCTGITGVEVKATVKYLGENVFTSCKALTYAHFSDFTQTAQLYCGLFDACDKLATLQIDAVTPPGLVLYLYIPYVFNGDWTAEEQAEKLKIIVPEEAKKDYVIAWRYALGGFATLLSYDGSYTPAFRMLWKDAYDTLEATTALPADKDVDRLAKKNLLTLENQMRQMLEMESVSEPTDLYIWHMSDTQLSLAGVPSYIKNVTLDPATVDLPDVWYLDSIETESFSGAKQLESVTIPDNLSSIEPDAFRNSTEGDLKLIFKGKDPLSLLVDPGEKFSFGIEDNKLSIQVPEGTETTYINSWIYPLSGYKNEAAVLAEAVEEVNAEIEQEEKNAVKASAPDEIQTQAEEEPGNPEPGGDNGTGEVDPADGDKQPDTSETDADKEWKDRVQKKAREILRETENRLRRMMGMAEVTVAEDGSDDSLLVFDVSKLSRNASGETSGENPDAAADPEADPGEESLQQIPEEELQVTDETKSQEEAPAPSSDVVSELPQEPGKEAEETDEPTADSSDSKSATDLSDTEPVGENNTDAAAAKDAGNAAKDTSSDEEKKQTEKKAEESSALPETTSKDNHVSASETSSVEEKTSDKKKTTKEKKSRTDTGAQPDTEADITSPVKEEGETK